MSSSRTLPGLRYAVESASQGRRGGWRAATGLCTQKALVLLVSALLTACGASRAWHHPRLSLPQEEARDQAATECDQVAKDEAERLMLFMRLAPFDRAQSGTSLYVGPGGRVGVGYTVDVGSMVMDSLTKNRFKTEAFEKCMQGKGWVKDNHE